MGDEEMPALGQPLEISLASRSEIQAIASEMVQHYIEHLDVADLIQRIDTNPISIQAIDAIENSSITATTDDDRTISCEFRSVPMLMRENFQSFQGERSERFDEILQIIDDAMFKGLTPTEMYISGDRVPNPFGGYPEQREYEIIIRFVGNEQ